MYDPKCRDLAGTFFEEWETAHRTLSTPERLAHIEALSQAIQDAIEDYLTDLTHADMATKTSLD